MALKDIIATVDGSGSGRERLAVAMRLAQRFGARITAYYMWPTVGTREDPAGRPSGYAELAESMEAQFSTGLNARGVEGRWFLSTDEPADDIARHLRAADLAVLGLGDPDAPPDERTPSVEDVILRSGRPVLGLPMINLPEETGRTVLVAWDGSREASRALHDAMPFLEAAQSVTVLTVDGALKGPVPESAAAHLRRHGVKAEAKETVSGDLETGMAILSYAEHLHADLVVAGAYGHSRLSESILGGVSRTLLHQMMVPVLMSH